MHAVWRIVFQRKEESLAMRMLERFSPVVLLGLWLGLLPAPCLAQSSPGSGPLDIVVALDNSGSMKRNDPNSLMRGAVSDFASRLSPDSRLGIVVFDQGVRVALGLTAASESDFSAKITESLGRVDYSGKWTDIPGGVERAIYELRQQGRPDAQRVVVFFTDGVVETGDSAKDAERTRWLREDLAQEAKQRGIRVFGVAFTDDADVELIQAVAQTTGGEHYRVVSAPDIAGVFEQITARVRRLSEAPPVTAVALPAPALSRGRLVYWSLAIVGLILVIGLVGLAWRRDVKPTVAAQLRDVGGHSGQDFHSLGKRVIRVGRDSNTNDVVIDQVTVSSQHANIEFRDGMFFVRDLRSANGTFVNGKRISDPDTIREAPLKHGDRIRFDAYEFEFAVKALTSLPQTPLSPDAAVTPGGTVLRGAAPVVPMARAAADATPPDVKLRQSVAGDGVGAQTLLKTGKCHNHPAWNAVAVCPTCQREKCHSCMTQKDGRAVCIDCAEVAIDGRGALPT